MNEAYKQMHFIRSHSVWPISIYSWRHEKQERMHIATNFLEIEKKI